MASDKVHFMEKDFVVKEIPISQIPEVLPTELVGLGSSDSKDCVSGDLETARLRNFQESGF
jgi:hypothetical protein